MQNVEDLEPRKTTFVVLQALTRLRQIAIHPRLIDPDSGLESGKFNEILSMLEILVSENHKILVFSSFVKHLNLLDEACRKMNWGFCKLTGKTTDRKSVIEEFQSRSNKNIFLISLKAGGVGLNLTAADYIFIVSIPGGTLPQRCRPSAVHIASDRTRKCLSTGLFRKKVLKRKIQLLQVKKGCPCR